MRKLNLVGKRFGRLVVTSYAFNKGVGSVWNVLCDCGSTATCRGTHLQNGRTKSCGCLNSELSTKRNTVHGLTLKKMRPSVELSAYYGARKRCTNTKSKRWKDYGGRGIKFLFISFEQFFAEVGPRTSSKHSLDRIENDGNYEPGNMRWASKKEQNNNRRSSTQGSRNAF